MERLEKLGVKFPVTLNPKDEKEEEADFLSVKAKRMKIRKNENMTIYKLWKSSIFLISTLFLWGCSNMKVKDFKPDAYFSHEIESEMAMANAIYYSNNELVKDYIKTGRVDINTPGKYGFTYLMYAIYIYKSMIWQNSY